MSSVLLILQFVFATLITITVMLQKSSSIGLGAYSGSNESVFGAKGATGFLVKLTVILAVCFIVNTIALSYSYSSSSDKSILDNVTIPAPATTTQGKIPVAPAAPITPPSSK